MAYLTDILTLLGLLLLTTGVWLAFGVAWALIMAGALLVAVGVLGAWLRTRAR